MNVQELRSLPLGKFFEFTLYHGETLYGYPVYRDGNWYLENHISYNEQLRKIIPAQIEEYKIAKDARVQSNSDNILTIEGNPRFSTLIIIGAGASFDYSYAQNIVRPPLAKDLFENKYSDIISQHSGVEALASQILQAKDIENYFQQQWNKIETNYHPVLLQKLIDVQYYLHYLFQNFSHSLDFRRNNYSGFFQALEDSLIQKGPDEKALIVSFNYDTILEQSLSRALHYQFNNHNDYININKNRFALLKPHGSWNWVRSFKDSFLATIDVHRNQKAVSISKALYDNKISLGKINSNLAAESKVINLTAADYYYPQILIPFKSKDSFVMPEKHEMLLEKFLNQVDKIIIIGWKGSEEKFKALLKQHLGNKKIWILYANNKDDSIQKELLEVLPNANISEIAIEKRSVSTFTELNAYIQEYPESIL